MIAGGGLLGIGFLTRNAFSATPTPRVYIPLAMSGSDGSTGVVIPLPATATPTVVPVLPTALPSATPTAVPAVTPVPILTAREVAVIKGLSFLYSVQKNGMVGNLVTTRRFGEILIKRGESSTRIREVVEIVSRTLTHDTDPEDLAATAILLHPALDMRWAGGRIASPSDDPEATLNVLANARWALKILGFRESDHPLPILKERIMRLLRLNDPDALALVKLAGIGGIDLNVFQTEGVYKPWGVGRDSLSTTAFCSLAQGYMGEKTQSFILSRQKENGEFRPDNSNSALLATVLAIRALMIP